MARRWLPVMTVKLFTYTGNGSATHSNSKFRPHIGKPAQPGTVTFSPDKMYDVQLFENDDGTRAVRFQEVIEYQADDNIADDISQPALKPVVQVVQMKHADKGDIDDDIPF